MSARRASRPAGPPSHLVDATGSARLPEELAPALRARALALFAELHPAGDERPTGRQRPPSRPCAGCGAREGRMVVYDPPTGPQGVAHPSCRRRLNRQLPAATPPVRKVQPSTKAGRAKRRSR